MVNSARRSRRFSLRSVEGIGKSIGLRALKQAKAWLKPALRAFMR
jgi:hypothetical protein